MKTLVQFNRPVDLSTCPFTYIPYHPYHLVLFDADPVLVTAWLHSSGYKDKDFTLWGEATDDNP